MSCFCLFLTSASDKPLLLPFCRKGCLSIHGGGDTVVFLTGEHSHGLTGEDSLAGSVGMEGISVGIRRFQYKEGVVSKIGRSLWTSLRNGRWFLRWEALEFIVRVMVTWEAFELWVWLLVWGNFLGVLEVGRKVDVIS